MWRKKRKMHVRRTGREKEVEEAKKGDKEKRRLEGRGSEKQGREKSEGR